MVDCFSAVVLMVDCLFSSAVVLMVDCLFQCSGIDGGLSVSVHWN